MNKTIFCDIDGTLLKHHGGLHPITQEEPELLPNVIEAIVSWKNKDYKIIKSYRPLNNDQYFGRK